VPLVKPAMPALQALQAELANPAKMVLPVPLVLPVMLAVPVAQAKLAAQALQETQAKMVHPAAANTAHRLVWLQVIKRSISRAIRQIGRQLGRLFYDQDHHLIKKISAYLLPLFIKFLFPRFYLMSS